jgi:2-dehydro-3-deoxyphosphogluconate aldolase / (4S)-4-hydroxy-2-oxoglutarate aldolase
MRLLDLAPVIPVVVLDDADKAVPVARALGRGGVPVIELTLRTEAALESIRRIAAEVPEVTVGAGTVVSPQQVWAAAEAGAKFLVSPGSTPALLDEMEKVALPVLPGVATASEALALLERGVTEMKFFPAEAAGGWPLLASLVSVLPTAHFCPTGGITASNARDYLALINVGSVGGSWLTPPDAVEAGDWDRVEQLARATLRLETR